MIETSADLRWLAREADLAGTASSLMRVMIIYLTEHPLNAHSWRLSGINYTWDIDSLKARVDGYISRRLPEVQGDVPDVTRKNEDVFAPGTLQLTIDRLQNVVNAWDTDAEQLHMAEEISTVLACYETPVEIRNLLREALQADTCEESSIKVKEVLRILKGGNNMNRVVETYDMVCRFEKSLHELSDRLNERMFSADYQDLCANIRRTIVDYLDAVQFSGMGETLKGDAMYESSVVTLIHKVDQYIEIRKRELRPRVTESETLLNSFKKDFEDAVKHYNQVPIGSDEYRDAAKKIREFVADYKDGVELNNLMYLLNESEPCVGTLIANVFMYIDSRLDRIVKKEEPTMNNENQVFVDETIPMLNVLNEQCICTEQEIESGFNALTIADDVRRFIKNHVLSVGRYDETELLNQAVKIIPGDGKDYTSIRAQLILVRDYIDKRTVKLQESEKEKEETMNEVEMVECEYCNQKHPIDECTQLSNGNYVCESCKEEHYFTCEECGDLHCDEDGHWIESEEIQVCHRCFDRLFGTCDACGEAYRVSDMRESDSGDYYCESCYDDRFTSCDHCGCEVYRDDAYWTDHDECLCECCYDRYNRNKIIHDYHDDSVEFEMNTYEGEPINNDTLIIGVEHEVGGDRDYAEGFVNIVNDRFEECNVALFRDSSVDGFEIVSMPMTIEYFKKTFLPVYKEGLDYLKRHGFKGHNEGGIHIHFNKIKDSMQVARLCNILYGTMDDVKAWCKITQRDPYEMDRWCSMKDRKYSTIDILRDDLMKATSNRHTALNYDDDRTYTHELRIFNSTIDIDEYSTCVEVLMSLLDFIRTDIGKGAYVNTRDWVQYVMEFKDCYTLVHQRLLDTGVYEDYGFEEADYLMVPPQEYELTPIDLAMIDDVVNAMDMQLDDELHQEIDRATEAVG